MSDKRSLNSLAVSGLLLLTVAGCSSPSLAPPSEVPESEMTPSHAAFAAPFTTYTDEYYNFAVDYPSDVEVSVQSEGPFQLLVYTDPENPFYIRATRDFLPGYVAYFLDTSPIAETAYGAYVWQTYHLPNGYGDAIGFSPPIYALQMQAGDVLYTIVFFNQDSLTELQAHILSTFRILNSPTPAPAMSVPTTVPPIAVPTPTVFVPGVAEFPNIGSAEYFC